ncbi:MAG: hypothetical protein IPF48_13295, partial [Sphingomonadales bacterium]|nr:hypothetical protein [Sphingomonadales bacterium]
MTALVDARSALQVGGGLRRVVVIGALVLTSNTTTLLAPPPMPWSMSQRHLHQH